jgi:predicted SprT family Zn-dependent metalloprotease
MLLQKVASSAAGAARAHPTRSTFALGPVGAPVKVRPTEEAYAELQHAYDRFNEKLFNGRLPGALLTLQREKDTFGYFSRNRFVGRRAGEKVDEIALNPSFFAVVRLVEVLQTLVHEMCHRWQHHFGQPGRGRYHNHEWAAMMERVGLMPSDTGQPGGRKVGEKVADYAIAGGTFLQACQELISEEFKLTWLDRFPSYKQFHGMADIYSLQISPEAGGGGRPMEELANMSGAVLDVQVVGPIAVPAVVLPEAPKQQTRLRYQCKCENRVWGRPGLSIICGECRNEFVSG